jgi:hypothetical protein
VPHSPHATHLLHPHMVRSGGTTQHSQQAKVPCPALPLNPQPCRPHALCAGSCHRHCAQAAPPVAVVAIAVTVVAARPTLPCYPCLRGSVYCPQQAAYAQLVAGTYTMPSCTVAATVRLQRCWVDGPHGRRRSHCKVGD